KSIGFEVPQVYAAIVHAGIAVLVRDPNKRRVSGEDPPSSANLCGPFTGDVPVKPKAGRDQNVSACYLGSRITREGFFNLWITRRLIRQDGNVGANTKGQRQVIGKVPLVLSIKSKLNTIELGRWLATRQQVTVRVLIRVAGFEILNTAEDIRSVIILNKLIIKSKDLIACSNRKFMVAYDISEVIGDLDQILSQAVGLREAVNSHKKASVALFLREGKADFHFGKGFGLNIPGIANAGIYRTKGIGSVISKTAVELCNQ